MKFGEFCLAVTGVLTIIIILWAKRRRAFLAKARKPKRKRVAIVGAGIAGLSAGVHAASNGFDVHVFEHHRSPGGVCSGWRRGKFVFDGCIHWAIGNAQSEEDMAVFTECGAIRSKSDAKVKSVLGTWIDERDGRRFLIDGNLAALERVLGTGGREDAAVAKEFVGVCREFKRCAGPSATAPAEHSGLLDNIVMLWRVFPLIRKLKWMKISCDEYSMKFRDSFSQFLVKSIFSPRGPVMFNMMALGMNASGSLFVPRGGSQHFSDQIAERLQSLGGYIHYSKDVSRIRIGASGQVNALEFADGSIYEADYVIAACDIRTVLDKLLDAKHPCPTIEKDFRELPLFSPICMVNYGIRKEINNWPENVVIRLDTPFASAGNVPIELGNLRIWTHDSEPALCPPGCTIVQWIGSSSLEYWQSLPREQYRQQKEELANAVFERFLARHLGLSAHDVETTDVATPLTYIRYTRCYHAAFEGFEVPCSMRFLEKPTRSVPGVKGLYLAGQWITPGGGISPSITTGRDAAYCLCVDEGIPYCKPDRPSLASS